MKPRVAAGFALMPETASDDFEVMLRLVSGEQTVVPQEGNLGMRATAEFIWLWGNPS
jgi:hypothetical protein